MKKFLKIIGGIILIPYLFVVIIMTVCLINYNKYGVTEIFDKTFVIVSDDSLKPLYQKGDLLIVTNKGNDDIASGDQIFFYEQNKQKKRVVINLAKVVSKRKITNVETTFEIDGGYEYSSEYVIGSAKNTVVYHKLGSVLKILSSRWIFLFVIILPILFIFLYELYEFILEVKRNLKEAQMKKYFYSLLTILCFSFLLCQIVKTYSLFESNIDNEVGVSVASWKIKVGDTYITSLSNDDESFDLGSIKWESASHVRDGSGAPGSKGSFDIIINPLTTDTSFLYEIFIDKDKMNNSMIEITSVREVGGHEFFNYSDNTYRGIALLKDIKNKVTYDIRVDLVWKDNGDNNSSDYALGTLASKRVNLPIKVMVRQYDGKE